MPRWYLIGRLGRRSSTWAYFILGQLVLAAWLLEGMPMPTSAAGAGAFIGCIISSFAFSAVFGWIVSMLAWKCCKKSQGAALAGFFFGAAGIFALVVMGNVRIEQAQAIEHAPSITQVDTPAIHFDVFDRVALEQAIRGTARVSVEDRARFAQAYLTYKMPAELVPVYEQAIRSAVVPDPLEDWKGPLSMRLLKRLGELVPSAPTQSQIPAPPAGFVMDSPKTVQPPTGNSVGPISDWYLDEYFLGRIKANAKINDSGDLVGTINSTIADLKFLILHVDIELFVKNADGGSADHRTLAAEVRGTPMRFSVPGVCKLSPGQTWTWRITRAIGHHVDD